MYFVQPHPSNAELELPTCTVVEVGGLSGGQYRRNSPHGDPVCCVQLSGSTRMEWHLSAELAMAPPFGSGNIVKIKDETFGKVQKLIRGREDSRVYALVEIHAEKMARA